MARKDHVYVNLDRSLWNSIGRVIESKQRFGVQKYTSHKDFIQKAVWKLLEQENKAMEVTV